MMHALPMTALQWGLIIFGACALLLVIALSRRDRGGVKVDRQGSRVIAQPKIELPASYGAGSEFDEFGVSKPRRQGEQRVAPTVHVRTEPIVPRPPPPPPMPSFLRDTPPATAAPPAPGAAAAEKPPPAPAKKPEEKILTLLIAEREGTAILGPKIHQALTAEGLHYGAMQIYHRMAGERAVFGVASLLKPGYLNPAEAAGFSTLGLSVFMVLPGPREPLTAFDDMLGTAFRLASRLRAEVFDGKRQPLTAQAAKVLRNDVAAWASGNGQVR